MSKNLIQKFTRMTVRGFAYTRLPKLDGVRHLAGLKKPVQIIRDEWGIPHIYAENQNDLYFAQGFAHAQDRLWQMDFNRRLVAGRLSEIIGDASLPLDRWMRILTLRRVAEYEETLIQEQTKQALQSYANGVNSYLASGKLPVEFSLLRYKPEPWTIIDSISWIKMMAWTLSVNWEMEILRAQVINRLGREEAAEFEIPLIARWPYIVPPGINYDGINSQILDRALQAKPFVGPSPYDGLGSNNWVVSGKWTASGSPLLANDMHLGLTIPSIWYENHLSTNDLTLYGVTFPGIPGIVSGHNGHVAWGFTNGFPDVQDLFIEHLRKTKDGGYEAEYQGHWEKCRVLSEKILIKGHNPTIQEVVITRHGPIINDLAPDLSGDTPLALCWTALDPDPMIDCLGEIFQAKNNSEFHHAMSHWTTPAQNVVFADLDGNIGYVLAGKIPLRNKGQGKVPVPGWTNEYEWISYLPYETLPRLENPSQGFIVTANHQVVDATYPVRLELETITGDRAQRISEMILDVNNRNNVDEIDANYFRKIHFDQCSPTARMIARHLSKITLPISAHSQESELVQVIRIFNEWDGTLNPESLPALIYEMFIRKLVFLVLHKKLDPEPSENHEHSGEILELTSKVMGKGPTPVLAETTLYGDRWLSWISTLCDTPNSPWFDLGQGEKRNDCFIIALSETIQELKRMFGPEMSKWSWGKVHQLTLNHPLSANSVIASAFNIGPFPIGGDHTTVWATGTSYHNLDSSHMVGPAYRMIIDLANLEKSIAVMVAGQSGNPASPHFNDQTQAWLNGIYHPMLINRAEIDAKARHQLRLEPGE